MALQAEIGLYFDFSVDADGMPEGCDEKSNLFNGNFKLSKWEEGNTYFRADVNVT